MTTAVDTLQRTDLCPHNKYINHGPLREKREAIEAERGARRRAKDRAEAARNERKAKTLARKEMQRRKEALDLLEENAR